MPSALSERAQPAAQEAPAPPAPAPAAVPSAHAVLALQQSAGNQAVTAMLRAPAPLPGDAATRPLPSLRTAPPRAPGPSPPSLPSAIAKAAPALSSLYQLGAVQRLEGDGASAAPPAGIPAAAASSLASLGSGSPLSQAARARFEAAYGHRLDPVRVHTGPVAARATRALGAQAVTLGDHILMGAGADPGTAAGSFVLGHELAHVVQSRRHPAAGIGRISQPGDASEREATAAALAALAGRPTELREGASDDPQAIVWWVLALIGLGVGAAVAGTAAVTGHGTEENRANRVREQRGTAEDVIAWIPIAGSVQDVWQAESNLQLALGVGFLAFDCATLGGTGMVVRALARVPRAAFRVLARGAERAAEEGASRAAVRLAGEELTEQALEQATREFAQRGGVVASTTATEEISRALARDGAMVFAMEGGHAVMYANRAGQIFKVHGGPMMVRFAITELTERGAQQVAERAVSGAGSREGAVTAYVVLQQGAPLTLAALERLPSGVAGATEAIGRALFGNPTSCGILQGAAMEASGLSAEAAARLLPTGGASGRFLPITLVDHWLETGAGRLVEGGAGQLLYGATGTATQGTMALAQVAGRVLIPGGARQAGEQAADPGPMSSPRAAGPPPQPPPAGGAVSAPVPDLDGGAAAAATPTADVEHARRLEQAASQIVERWGREPGPEQIEAIRRELPSMVPGWLIMTDAAHAPLRTFLRSAGMPPAAVDAILA